MSRKYAINQRVSKFFENHLSFAWIDLPAFFGPVLELVYAARFKFVKASQGSRVSGTGGWYRSALCGRMVTSKLVNHHHQLHRPSLISPDEDEIPRPHVAAMLRTKPHARPVVQPQPAAFRLFRRHLQPFTTPQSHPPTVTHLSSLRLQQCMNTPVSVTAILPRQPHNRVR